MTAYVLLICNLIRIIFIISKKQIFTYTEDLKLPIKIKTLGYLLQLICYPVGLFIKPKEEFSKRFTACLEELGPIYIKFGQTLSTRPDLTGYKVAESLKYLQDGLPPFSSLLARQIIEKSLGKTIKELFAFFDDIPVAAASISQVHKARLLTGENVAIKILRPEIAIKYNNDIKTLYFLAKLASKLSSKFKRLKLLEVVDVFKKTMHYELDLRLEAASALEMANNFVNDQDIYIPKIYWHLTTQHILTSEWIDGISIYDTENITKQGLVSTQISAKLAVMFFNQAYRDGFFHADLHPGNILVKPDGTIALIDFGIMGRLSERDRIAVAEILFAFLRKDYKSVAKIHLKVGYIPTDTDIDLFAQTCRAVSEPIIGLPVREISIAKLLAQLFQITEDFGMETQPQLLLLQKTMLVVEGIGQSLDQEINMWQLAEPWIKKWAAKNISIEAKILKLIKNMTTKLLDEL